MTHLTSDELIDAAEDVLDPDRRAHLDACAQCQRAVADLSATLRDMRGVDVPEPSPLFWNHFSARVRDAVGAETIPAGQGGWASLLGWRLLVPVAGLALLVLALMWTMPRPAMPGSDQPIAAAMPDTADADPLGNDQGWLLVAELVGPIDWETATAAGLNIRPGAAELAVLDLNADEQQELRRLLDVELRRPKS